MFTSADQAGCAVGAFVNGLDNLAAFQQLIGRQLAVVLWYVHWLEPFPAAEADAVSKSGSTPLITWEPWISGGTAAIAAGQYEQYVRTFLQAAREWGKPLLLRFAHEMNGNWYPWDGWHNGSAAAGPARYKQAWRYIYNVNQELHADNVRLVWCVNNRDLPATAWNDSAAYYPGDDCVDWVGLDGYNWGYGSWEPFDAVFKTAYAKITGLTSKPLMIGEVGAAEQGGSKAGWLTNALTRLGTEYPRIRLFCWFNINKERDWRIDSSGPAQAAFRNALQNNYFSDRILML